MIDRKLNMTWWDTPPPTIADIVKILEECSENGKVVRRSILKEASERLRELEAEN